MKRNKFNTFIWKSFKILPSFIRGRLTRHFFEFKLLNNDSFEFKLVDNQEELVAALKIVTDSYIKTGLSNNKNFLLVNKYHLLPSTRFFISKDRKLNQVVAVLAVIHKTNFGFPIEKHCDIKKVHLGKERACEIVSLAIREENRSRNSGVFFMLILYAVKYLKVNNGVNSIFISVRNSVRYFYEDLFNYKPICKPKHYKEVNSVLGIPLYLNIDLCICWLRKTYNDSKLSKNIYQLYDTLPWKENCDFSFQPISNTQLAKELFDYLTSKNHPCILSLKAKEKEKLFFHYFNNIQVFYKGILRQGSAIYPVYIYELNQESVTIFGIFPQLSRNFELNFDSPKPISLKSNQFEIIDFNLWRFIISHSNNQNWLDFYNSLIFDEFKSNRKLAA